MYRRAAVFHISNWPRLPPYSSQNTDEYSHSTFQSSFPALVSLSVNQVRINSGLKSKGFMQSSLMKTASCFAQEFWARSQMNKDNQNEPPTSTRSFLRCSSILGWAWCSLLFSEPWSRSAALHKSKCHWRPKKPPRVVTFIPSVPVAVDRSLGIRSLTAKIIPKCFRLSLQPAVIPSQQLKALSKGW